MQNKPTKDEKDAFCRYYAELGNITEAAEKAGFSKNDALEAGLRCLSDKRCRRKIEAMRRLIRDSRSVDIGIRRLAFGSCTDAAVLVFSGETPLQEVIGRLDLFNVSEIKRDKNGGVEVRFFDRMKALEKLYELDNAFSGKENASRLINALNAQGEEDEALDDR